MHREDYVIVVTMLQIQKKLQIFDGGSQLMFPEIENHSYWIPKKIWPLLREASQDDPRIVIE